MLSKNDEYVITGSERFVETLDIARTRGGGGGGGRGVKGIANGKRRFDGEELTLTTPIDTSKEEEEDDEDEDEDKMLPPPERGKLSSNPDRATSKSSALGFCVALVTRVFREVVIYTRL